MVTLLFAIVVMARLNFAEECNGWERISNHQFLGGIEERSAHSETDCRDVCLSRPFRGLGNCDGIDWNKARSACYTFSNIRAGQERNNNDVDSLVRKCPRGAKGGECTSWKRQPNHQYFGGKDTWAPSEEKCKEACLFLPMEECRGVDWNTKRSACYILPTIGAGASNNDVDTFVRQCGGQISGGKVTGNKGGGFNININLGPSGISVGDLLNLIGKASQGGSGQGTIHLGGRHAGLPPVVYFGVVGGACPSGTKFSRPGFCEVTNLNVFLALGIQQLYAMGYGQTCPAGTVPLMSTYCYVFDATKLPYSGRDIVHVYVAGGGTACPPGTTAFPPVQGTCKITNVGWDTFYSWISARLGVRTTEANAVIQKDVVLAPKWRGRCLDGSREISYSDQCEVYDEDRFRADVKRNNLELVDVD